MSDLIARVLAWWQSGELLLSVMLGIGLLLYAVLTERSLMLPGCDDEAPSDDAGTDPGRGLALARVSVVCLPLLGLLGTVSGMVGVFAGLAADPLHVAQATGPSGALSGGLGLALTTTQYGLGLALPGLIWLIVLERRAAALRHRSALARGLRSPAAEAPCAS